MLIIGAKGFAKEILEIFDQLNKLELVSLFILLPSSNCSIKMGTRIT